MNSFIWITTDFEGFHKYVDAPDEVSFLRLLHRHIFKVRVWIEVRHNNREIEFFMFKKAVNATIFIKFDYGKNVGSCEMVSDKIYDGLIEEYPDRDIWIEVSEDGENGSFKKYKQKRL